jgi:hypothetical protein
MHITLKLVISGGTINVLNPLEIMRQLRLIAQNYTLATAVDVTVILHPDLVFDEAGYQVIILLPYSAFCLIFILLNQMKQGTR